MVQWSGPQVFNVRGAGSILGKELWSHMLRSAAKKKKIHGNIVVYAWKLPRVDLN